MKIKICGLRRPEDISYVNDAKPDYAGFILSPGYRRSITEDKLSELVSLLDPDIIPVGVFVDDDADRIRGLVDKGLIKVVQLHGNESREFVELLFPPGPPIVKVFKPGEYEADFPCDFHMMDPGRGEGNEIDLDSLPAVDHPWVIAGGIDISNLDSVIKYPYKDTPPFLVDVSSGVETDGVKDREKIMKLVERIRGYE